MGESTTLCNYILCHKWSISHSAMHCCCNSTWITWCHTSGSSRTVFLTLSLISSRFTASSLLVTKMGPNSFCCRIWISMPQRFHKIFVWFLTLFNYISWKRKVMTSTSKIFLPHDLIQGRRSETSGSFMLNWFARMMYCHRGWSINVITSFFWPCLFDPHSQCHHFFATMHQQLLTFLP